MDVWQSLPNLIIGLEERKASNVEICGAFRRLDLDLHDPYMRGLSCFLDGCTTGTECCPVHS